MLWHATPLPFLSKNQVVRLKVARTISKELKLLADGRRAEVSARFFKTGKGEYGEGDVFHGITVPQTRLVAKKYSRQATLADVNLLLNSRFHEERLIALLILVSKFEKAGARERKKIFAFYLKNAKRVNNWDLVDLSADKIMGPFLEAKGLKLLKKLAESDSVWERRIAIISTFHYIKNGDCKRAFEIARILLNDRHDLIQKAVGWMLREAGKRCSEKQLCGFLDANAKRMPRTMLRYAIERLPKKKRLYYLKKEKP